jgi:DNA-directed RNA polymerase subunit RPC12/RpoP
MGLDWNKARRREQGNRASRAAADDGLRFADLRARRAARRRQELFALIRDYDGPVRRLDTHVAVRCRTCGHRGTALVPQGVTARFRCSRCRSTLVAVSHS